MYTCLKPAIKLRLAKINQQVYKIVVYPAHSRFAITTYELTSGKDAWPQQAHCKFTYIFLLSSETELRIFSSIL